MRTCLLPPVLKGSNEGGPHPPQAEGPPYPYLRSLQASQAHAVSEGAAVGNGWAPRVSLPPPASGCEPPSGE